MTEIQNVTGTAFVVAEYRAQENAEQNPLYRDPIVPLFLSEQTRRAADRIAAGFPPSGEGVRLRTRFFDDRLDEELGRRCQPVVILGAGLDTRGMRKQAAGVTYFEIDEADILPARLKVVRQLRGMHARHVVTLQRDHWPIHILDQTYRTFAPDVCFGSFSHISHAHWACLLSDRKRTS